MSLTRLRSPAAATRWLREWTTGQLRTDSRELQAGDAFIAWPGYSTDGRRYVGAALAAGAATCLVEADGVEAYGFDNARVGALPALKAATGEIADAWFGEPSKELDVIAVTGTNGKTSTAWWTAQALGSLGRRCGVVGTLGIGEPPRAAAGGEPPHSIEFTGLTTPDPVRLHGAFRRMADAGYAACAIEASSIGIVEHRLAGVRIAVAIFTNFTRDHLDFHGSMDAYWQAKQQLFAWPGLHAAVLNIDDPKGAELAAGVGGIDLWTCSSQGLARLEARNVGYADGGLAFDVHEGTSSARVASRLIGDYNVANLLGVIGALRALGVSLAKAAECCRALTPVPGRLQRVGSGSPEVVVDYAHTPDALDKVLLALRPLAAARGGRLIALFGCGGNRDATKRPLMAAIAEQGADRVVATSDNPRDESPAAILEQVAAGFASRERVEIIEDRRAAIARAIGMAADADVVVLAGKGHEDYQEIAGSRLPFSDAEEAERALRARGGRA